MTFAQRLRRLLHRPPTVEDCLRAADEAGCDTLRAPDSDDPEWRERYIRESNTGPAPCKPLIAPENPHSHGEVSASREDYATGGYVSPGRAVTVGEGSRYDVWPAEMFKRCPVGCRQPVCPQCGSEDVGRLAPGCLYDERGRLNAAAVLHSWHCEPPHKPVVNGPGLVERTKASHAAHIAAYGDDTDFPVTEWGTFAENHLGHDAAEEA